MTKHQVEIRQCQNCGTINSTEFPKGVNYPVQYGERLKSTAVYLNNYQLLPYERITEIFMDIFSHNLSPATLYNANQICYEKLEDIENRIKEDVINSPVVHFDEIGIYSNNKRQWLHTASTETLTYYAMDEKREKKVMDRIGILPRYNDGIAVHDHFSSYTKYNCKHAFCNVHHLRELTFIEEKYGKKWGEKMKEKKVINNHWMMQQ